MANSVFYLPFLDLIDERFRKRLDYDVSVIARAFFLTRTALVPNSFSLRSLFRSTGPSTYNENETIAKYEIMDGAPVRGESIPIRVFLAGYDLTPTMRDINKKFSVRYYLNLVLVDEEDRRYFKQQVRTSADQGAGR